MNRTKFLKASMFSVVVFFGVVLNAANAEGKRSPEFKQTDLWVGGTNGYATYRIPGLVVTKKGTVLAYTAARKSLGTDWADTDILLRRSIDGGISFSPSQRIAGAGHGTFDNPTAIADMQTGEVFLLYQRDYQRCFLIRSEDDGLTFSAPVDISEPLIQLRSEKPWNVVAPGPTHGIQLRNGRLIAPVWLADGKIHADGHPAHAPSFVTTLYSNDHGRSWKHGDILLADDEEFKDPSETDIVELGDGSVMLNMRTASTHHRRVLMRSPDGISAWSRPVYDEGLFDPICNAGLVRGKVNGTSVLLFSNPDSSSAAPKGNRFPRQQMTLRMSLDDGKTWPVARVVDAGVAGYSDVAIAGQHILILYEAGSIGEHDTNPARLTLIRCTLDWLKNGRESFSK